DLHEWADYIEIRKNHFTFGRSGLYHYCLWAPAYLGPDGLPSLSSGLAEIGGDSFVVTQLPSTNTSNSTRVQQAGTFMHELGHNLGLCHTPDKSCHSSSSSGGADNYRPNYFSVMNYLYQLSGLRWRASPTVNHLDFSREDTPSINEKKLNELTGF